MVEEKGIVEYRSRDGQQIKLSPSIIKRFLVSGKSELVTDQELYLYMGVCKARGMNPFTRDAYLVKYTPNDTAGIITSIDYYRKRARAQSDCRGWKTGIVVQNEEGEIEYRRGALKLENEKLLGGWFEALPDGWDIAQRVEVNLKRYIKKTKDGRTTRFWSEENQPEMIEKVAESQGLRRTWPDEFQGLYIDAEMQSQEAQDELNKAVKVKSSEPPPAAEQKPIGDILGKPETRAPKKHDCIKDGHRLQQDNGIFKCRECGGEFDPPYTAPVDAMEKTEDTQAEMNTKMEATRTAPEADEVKKTTNDEAQSGGEAGPKLKPSIQQVFSKIPARLKVSPTYKILERFANEFPDIVFATLIETPIESLVGLDTAIKVISEWIDVNTTTADDQKEKEPSGGDQLLEEPPLPDGPPEW